MYEIQLVQPPGASREVATVQLDGAAVPDGIIPRLRDGKTHHVVVTLRLMPTTKGTKPTKAESRDERFSS